jgi:hypothetical protein
MSGGMVGWSFYTETRLVRDKNGDGMTFGELIKMKAAVCHWCCSSHTPQMFLGGGFAAGIITTASGTHCLHLFALARRMASKFASCSGTRRRRRRQSSSARYVMAIEN